MKWGVAWHGMARRRLTQDIGWEMRSNVTASTGGISFRQRSYFKRKLASNLYRWGYAVVVDGRKIILGRDVKELFVREEYTMYMVRRKPLIERQLLTFKLHLTWFFTLCLQKGFMAKWQILCKLSVSATRPLERFLFAILCLLYSWEVRNIRILDFVGQIEMQSLQYSDPASTLDCEYFE